MKGANKEIVKTGAREELISLIEGLSEGEWQRIISRFQELALELEAHGLPDLRLTLSHTR